METDGRNGSKRWLNHSLTTAGLLKSFAVKESNRTSSIASKITEAAGFLKTKLWKANTVKTLSPVFSGNMN